MLGGNTFLQVVTLLDVITEAFNALYISEIPERSSNVTALFVNAPRLVSQPISYTIFNLLPFDVPVATAVDFVGLIYLLILAVTPYSRRKEL